MCFPPSKALRIMSALMQFWCNWYITGHDSMYKLSLLLLLQKSMKSTPNLSFMKNLKNHQLVKTSEFYQKLGNNYSSSHQCYLLILMNESAFSNKSFEKFLFSIFNTFLFWVARISLENYYLFTMNYPNALDS